MASQKRRWNAKNCRVGTMYLLHFRHPYHHARHYLGFATNLELRLIDHLSGIGSPLVGAVIEAGIEVFLARRWEQVTSKFERRSHLHRWHRMARCPICCGPSAYGRLVPRPDEVRPGWEQTTSIPSHLSGPLELKKLRAEARRIYGTALRGIMRAPGWASGQWPGAIP